MEARLEDIGRKFLDVETRYMKTGEIKARAKLEEVRSAFQEKRDAVQSRLGEVKKAGASALNETQEGALSAWNELVGALDRAKEELEEITD